MDFIMNDTGDGGQFSLQGGDLKPCDTFYNAINFSLFSGDCFYNIYTPYKTDNSFEIALNKPITANNLANVQTAANNLLQWLIDEEIADSIDVFAYGNKDERISVEITITEPDSNSYKFAILWENEKAFLKKV